MYDFTYAYLQVTDDISLILNNISFLYRGPPHKDCPVDSTCKTLFLRVVRTTGEGRKNL